MTNKESSQQVGMLPNGCTLYVKPNEVGGHTYYSDEIGGGVVVWDTCCVCESTLLAAMVAEHTRKRKEYELKLKHQRIGRKGGTNDS